MPPFFVGWRVNILLDPRKKHCYIPRFVRTGDRVVEGTSLENWHRGNSIEGSNPSLSATD